MLEKDHIIIILLIAIPTALLLAYLVPFTLWRYTREAGLKVNFFTLAGLRLKGLPGGKLMRALKCAKDHHLDVKLSDLIRHYKAGGDVIRWMEGAALVKESGLELSLEKAAEIELDGLEILRVAEILNEQPKEQKAV